MKWNELLKNAVNLLVTKNYQQIKLNNGKIYQLKNNNMQISYDNEELIEELKADIKEFGENCLMYAMFEVFQKFIVLTNYDFIDEEEPLTHDEINSYDLILELKAKDILKYLKIQNKLI